MLRPKHRFEMADARDCDQEARENRITNQVPAVALESYTAGAMLRPKAALPAMLRPKAALPAMLRPEAAEGSRRA